MHRLCSLEGELHFLRIFTGPHTNPVQSFIFITKPNKVIRIFRITPNTACLLHAYMILHVYCKYCIVLQNIAIYRSCFPTLHGTFSSTLQNPPQKCPWRAETSKSHFWAPWKTFLPWFLKPDFFRIFWGRPYKAWYLSIRRHDLCELFIILLYIKRELRKYA